MKNVFEGRTILLVEDEALIALAERVLLERHGYRVVIASTGEKAVEIARTEPQLSIVLMDIDLGRGMSGTEAAERILADRDVPLAFLSSHTEPEVVEKTEGITSYGYIVKNSGETVLLASIRMAFRLFEATRALKENEEKYRALFNNLQDAVFVADADTGMIDDANAHAQALVGRPIEEIRKLHQTQLHPPEMAKDVGNHFRQSIDFQGTYPLVEIPVRHSDGHDTLTEVSATSSYEIRGRRYHVGVFRDITERKRAEQAIIRNEKLYRTLMEYSRDGVKLIDRRGRVLNANHAACEMIGYTREELLGMSIPEIDPDYDEERFIRFWDDKQSLSSAYIRTTHRHKLGHLVPVEIHVIRFDLDGEQLLFGISRDITEQTRAQEALQRSEQHFRSIVQDSAAAYFRIGQDRCFQDVNPAWLALHGYKSHQEVIGKHFSITQTPEDVHQAGEVVDKLFGGQTVTEGEFSRVGRDGTVGYHRFAAAPVIEGGCVVAVEGFLIDTTEYHRTASIYRLLFQNMTAGFALHQMVHDSSGKPVDYRFVEVNPAFEAITGLRRSEILGKTVLEILPQTERYWIEQYATVAQTGTPLTYRNHSRELGRDFEVRAFSPERGQFATIIMEVEASLR